MIGYGDRPQRFCLIVAVLLILVTVAVVVISPDTWDRLGNEDAEVETLMVFAMLFFACVAAYKAARAPRGARAVLASIAFLGLLGAGEEISWGQRIFDVEAPAFFEKPGGSRARPDISTLQRARHPYLALTGPRQ